MTTDPVALTQNLVRCPSVTPEEGGALVLLEEMLSAAGFSCTRVDRGGVPNLFARWGRKGAPSFGFNGHTDVVPVGDAAAWTHDPFGGEIAEGWLYGRGATDMKSGVAAFAAAAVDFVIETPPDGAVILAITGDEEGPSRDGTRALLDWMDAEGERMDVCLVGEPTCPEEMGDMMKIGRRGSMNAWFTFRGQQGHAAYPHRAKNPLPAMARLMADLAETELDRGTAHFDPSTLAVVTMDTGNQATNVIPAEARATVNIRFNDSHSGATLTAWLRREAARVSEATGIEIGMEVKISGESFLTPPGPLSELVAEAVAAETGRRPVLSTSGGTSDARFVKSHCPVVEFGLVGHRMHAVDERVRVEQIGQLKAIYARILRGWFAAEENS
ncbi:succinyl-diaminopimelate desuccinylase [Jannaschia seohaensis]|uniref:Succinyl-diaminopimelate desuccinylase n=1 Tax=Jannaschia seohaensis TaxID=475081 RepID=A0A2Y9A1R8_9RHOB|nr:succinyl-diaminopimelate desuccinylase [Jannaschia seohaensis]PWJ22213.1 succinyl-diaminopimelate desuccinylase [Jannaschia seohaensis]SSA38491.1 succinyl-diaminopimelate desuccinylase [Jannaschia seohaensis]